MTQLLLYVAVAGVLWLWAVSVREARNLRVLSVLALMSVVVVVAEATPGRVAGYVAAAALACAAVVTIWPKPFGLASLTRTDVVADRVLRELGVALDDPAHPERALDLAPALHSPPFTTRGSPWAPVGRLYRQILSRLTDPDPSLEDKTPTGAIRRAGRHYWGYALGRRVIGRHLPPSAWDEDALVRSYLEEANRIRARAAATDDLIHPQDGWDIAAQGLIDDLSSFPLRHAAPVANSGLLIEALLADIAMAHGDQSIAAQERATTASDQLAKRWETPEEDPHVSAASPGASRERR